MSLALRPISGAITGTMNTANAIKVCMQSITLTGRATSLLRGIFIGPNRPIDNKRKAYEATEVLSSYCSIIIALAKSIPKFNI